MRKSENFQIYSNMEIFPDFFKHNRPEAKLVEDIVKDICGRLHISSFDGYQSKYVVGMDYHWEKMKALLEVESDDVRFIGICGMGGIGKTTIARYVYEKISYQYEVSCFLGDVRQEYESSGGRVVALQEQLLSKVMKQTNFRISDFSDGIKLIRRWLGSKKVLVVLDDVDDQLKQLNKLAGSHDWFGPKSRIIVTTRDQQVLKSHAILITYIYKVGGLNGDDALQLFRMNAFKNEHPTDDHVNLSSDIVNYAYGLPLALEVLGSHLCDTTVEHWKSTLDSLKDYPDGKIMKVLRISYDGLKQNQKDIFLHTACFFKGKKKDRVMKILDSCDLYSTSGINVLVDKSLVSISYNRLDMHNMLQEMGWEIVREKYPNVCGKWSRLWLFKDVQHVLIGNTGTDEVIGIMLNKPKEQIFQLNGKSFSSMSNLMLLKLSNVDISEDQIYLSNNLRFLKWHGFPLKTLPSNFQAQNLFKLNLYGSQINYLWKGIKDFPKLKTIKLSYSHNLIETPDFTMVPNLEMLDLKGCTRLRKVHESVGVLKCLFVLNLEGCKNLQSFPRDVSGLKSLKILHLQGCSKLDKFPENLEELEHLEELDVGGTAITQVPSSIARLTNLQKLSFRNCNSQPGWSWYLWRTNPGCLVLPSLRGLCSLKTLNLSECNLLEGTLPKDLDSLCSLEVLDLSKNKFISLPESINQLSKLEILCLENCEWLRSLPELPSNILFVGADGCHSLEDVSLRGCISRVIAMHLFNCPKLIQNGGHKENNLAVTLLIQRLQNFKIIVIDDDIGNEWFSCRSDDNSVEIGLPPNWLNDEFMGIAMCGALTPDHKDLDGRKIGLGATCCMEIMRKSYLFSVPLYSLTTFESDHLWLVYMSRERFEHERSLTLKSAHLDPREYEYDSTNSVLVSTSTCIHARFSVAGDEGLNSKVAIKSTGIRLVYKRDIECSEDDLPAIDASILHQHHNCSTFAGDGRLNYMSDTLLVSCFRLYGDSAFIETYHKPTLAP
ncbi:hypothetical protein Dsin_003668 [Dipteronia sinensis]|uniref:ADP-ribosyl cyclase/cyclic ADP-ribose hydrolase n=1 Tax=Dipteronia sinensis TaxID=43782 RepID=A0AAE0EL59_9ROSI|nr:hypothetical protein Dsin_003668 [Dipteronia sinensis]